MHLLQMGFAFFFLGTFPKVPNFCSPSEGFGLSNNELYSGHYSRQLAKTSGGEPVPWWQEGEESTKKKLLSPLLEGFSLSPHHHWLHHSRASIWKLFHSLRCMRLARFLGCRSKTQVEDILARQEAGECFPLFVHGT